MNSTQIAAYLNRIDYHGELAPTERVLRDLHRAHQYAVPFEDLDIHIGRPIRLDREALFTKIVEQRRGGFCYELNGLFAELLGALGFSVTLLSAGVAHPRGGFGPDFDHLTLRVDLDRPWLADVGFGDSFREPIRLEVGDVQQEPEDHYQIAFDGQHHVVLRGVGGQAKPQYRFTLEPRALADFTEMCHYQQTSPDSPFTQNRLCTRATPEGRVTLSGRRLIVTRNGAREETELADEAAVGSALWEYFGVRLD